MFHSWRLRLKQAQEAFRNGQLDDARRLLADEELRDCHGAKQLSAKVASEMVRRAQDNFGGGNSQAGWRDIQLAGELGSRDHDVLQVQAEAEVASLAEVEKYLQAGDPDTALVRLDVMSQRRPHGADARVLRTVALKLRKAADLARRGRFGEADSEMAAASTLRPELSGLKRRRKIYRGRRTRMSQLHQRLHQAVTNEKWNDVIALSDQILDLAPQSEVAAGARQKAWATTKNCGLIPTPAETIAHLSDVRPVVEPKPDILPSAPVSQTNDSDSRFLMWIDAVGGFLVDMASTVTLGQAVPGTSVNIPILGDVSRYHATIRRDGEGYLILPHAEVFIDGKQIEHETLLYHDCEIGLGSSVRLRFRQPHALSATACLNFVSRHRMPSAADSIMLLAESCVMGPASHCHVVCRDWRRDLVLSRQGDELYANSATQIEIDGVASSGRCPITKRSQISGEDFSLSLEPL